MSGIMTSVKKNLPEQYRARAREARERAATETHEDKRKLLLYDALGKDGRVRGEGQPVPL
jgi:hypothetical protein